ncbi:hypothetical protein C8721_002345 [Salmonella enterica subsp. enterica serovar Berta]|nr:hypothetical protein [Salmonella enterica subsp. enterica serovar Berta]
MRYLILIISLMGGFLSFNSYAKNSCPAIQVPFKFDLFLAHYVPSNSSHPENGTIPALDIHGCTYAITSFSCPEDADPSHSGSFCTATSMVLLSDDGDIDSPVTDSDKDNPDSKPDDFDIDNSSNKPDSGSSGETGGASDGSFGSSTPSSSQPQKPYPADAGASQLLGLYESCYSQAFSFPGDDDYDNAFNSVARNCNAILDRLSSILAPGKMHLLSDDGSKFLTKNGAGNVLYCHKVTDFERQEMLNRGYYPSMIPDAAGSSLKGIPYRDGHLNFNYTNNNGGNAYCDSVYQNFISSQNKPSDNSDNSDNFPSHETSNNTGTSSGGGASSHEPVNCPSGFHLSDVDGKTCFQVNSDGNVSFILPDNCPYGSDCWNSTYEAANSGAEHLRASGSSSGVSGSSAGAGHSDSGDGDNGDVVAAINAFHADNNKNHKELMDDLNKKPAPPDYTGMEGDFSSMVGGAMSGITDSVKSAWDAGKTAFGEGLSGIDSMLPNIKTSFDLPPGFEAASLGRCIPVVLDFDIKLIGIPDYHFHAVGTQVCLLYDKYIRPVLNFVMVMLSFFVIHRLLIRSAEFLTDGRN